MKKHLNNMIILALVLILVYQTGKLWLEENMGRNFFYRLKTVVQGGPELSAEKSEEIPPEAVIAGYGDKLFYVLRDSESYSSVLEKAGGALKELLNEGRFISSGALDWDVLLASRSVIFKFPFLVSASEYARWMGETGGIVADKADRFDYFGVSVLSSGSSRVMMFFINSEAGEVYTFELEKNDTAADFYNAAEDLRAACQGKLRHISTKQSGLNIFPANTFVPQLTGGKYAYRKVAAENPFIHGGDVSPGLLESAVYPFFHNLSAMRSSIDQKTGTYVFSDEVNVAKYYNTGLLEYYSYETAEGSADQSLATALAACNEFLAQDPTLDTGLFFAGAELRTEGLVFYFDYQVDDLPVVLSEDALAATGLTHAVEVTVKNNMVKKYRRYAYNFAVLPEAQGTANVDFAAAMGDAIELMAGNSPVVQIEDLYLGYRAGGPDSELGLSWFTEIGGKTFASPAYEEEALNP